MDKVYTCVSYDRNDKFMEFIKDHGVLDPENCKEMLLKTKAILDKEKVPFIVVWGTLLGAYRDNAFIPYDEDVDIALHTVYKEQVSLLIPEFERQGFEFLRDLGDIISLKYRNDYIDFYFLSKALDGYYRCYTAGQRFDAWQLESGLSDVEFLGEKFKTVNNPEAWFKTHYGTDWRTPIKDKKDLLMWQ